MVFLVIVNDLVIRMLEILKQWWQGTYVPAPPGVIQVGDYERHWSSTAAHVVWDFWLKYWQWCMGFGLAVVGLIWKH